jgi:hypothetical protein
MAGNPPVKSVGRVNDCRPIDPRSKFAPDLRISSNDESSDSEAEESQQVATGSGAKRPAAVVAPRPTASGTQKPTKLQTVLENFSETRERLKSTPAVQSQAVPKPQIKISAVQSKSGQMAGNPPVKSVGRVNDTRPIDPRPKFAPDLRISSNDESSDSEAEESQQVATGSGSKKPAAVVVPRPTASGKQKPTKLQDVLENFSEAKKRLKSVGDEPAEEEVVDVESGDSDSNSSEDEVDEVEKPQEKQLPKINDVRLADAQLKSRKPGKAKPSRFPPELFPLNEAVEGKLLGFINQHRYAVVGKAGGRFGEPKIEIRAILNTPKSTNYYVALKTDVVLEVDDVQKMHAWVNTLRNH